MPTFRFAMRDKLGRESSPQNFETIENELERLWAALKSVNDSISSDAATVDLSDYVKGPTPAASVDAEFALWSGTTGRLLKRGTGTGFVKAASGIMSVVTQINLSTDVTGLLPVANLALDGNATHVLFMDGTMRAIVKADISDFAHRLLSASHSDTVAAIPEPGAIIVGIASGVTIDAELYWIDGAPVPVVSTLTGLGGDDYWIDGEPLGFIGFSTEGQWAKLSPPAKSNQILQWTGGAFTWIDYP